MSISPILHEGTTVSHTFSDNTSNNHALENAISTQILKKEYGW